MSAEKHYQQRIELHESSLQAAQRALAWLPWARTASFLAFLALAGLAFTAPDLGVLWAGLALAALIGLLVLAAKHERHERDFARLRLLKKTNQWSLDRLRRNWSSLPSEETEVDDSPVTALDLNLIGRGSIMQLLGVANTREGRTLLQEWLLTPARPSEIETRQDAVRTLAPLTELRESLQVEARLIASSHAGPERLAAWAATDAWLAGKPLVQILRWLGPACVVLAMLAWTAGAPQSACLSVMIIAALVQVVCVIRYVGEAHETFDSVSTGAGEIHAYARLFELAEQLPSDNDLLREIRDALSNQQSVHKLRKLRRIVGMGDFRRGLTAPIYIAAQVLLMWDFQIVAAMDRWKAQHGDSIRTWFHALARWEALAALASLRHDHPLWCFPKVAVSEPPGLWAKQLGHPLLPNPGRICNDVELGPPGRFLLVTGSNMSGKSTLLRAIGANVALAQAGGPVCAAELRMSPMTLTTSMRVSDSLEQGVSFFMAELKRLRHVVDLAHEHQSGERTLCFLLDEILQGTNSKERHLAVTHILEKLATMGALGAVSTHDLELAKRPELADSCRPVHLSEGFSEDGGLLFEYELREGVSQTTNALRLLEIVGL